MMKIVLSLIIVLIQGIFLVFSDSTRRHTYSCSGDVSQEPITSLLIIPTTSTSFSCPTPYTLINQNLNPDSSTSIYACIVRGDASTRYGAPLTNIVAVQGSTTANVCPDDMVRIGANLNQGSSSSEYVYLCTSRWGSNAITDITFVTSSDVSCPSGYDKSSVNLNYGASSTEIYMCVEMACEVSFNSPKTLNYRSDGTFKIVQFTDTHHGESYDYDIKTQTLIYRPVIEIEDPDLVALTGDQVSGGSAVSDGGSFVESYSRVLDSILSLGYSYFYTNGNHDPEGDLNQREIVEADLRLGQNISFTQLGPSDVTGGANYYLPIYSYSNATEVASSIWVFDSNQYSCNGQSSGWGCIGTDQLDWYKNSALELMEQYGGSLPPALGYFHIPLEEYMQEFQVSQSDKSLCQGHKEEGVCCPNIQSGAFDAFLAIGDIAATFVGHDHDNDFSFLLNGIALTYGRKSGYGGYGPPLGMQRGSRVVVTREGIRGISETWIREEDQGRNDLGNCFAGGGYPQLKCS